MTTRGIRAFGRALACMAIVTAGACSVEDQSATDGGASSGGSDEGSGPIADAQAADDSLSPVRIGFATVDQGSIGLPGSTAGANAAAEFINTELGGVNGHPVELVTCSVDVDPQSNQACGQQFANDADMHVVNAGWMFNGSSFYSALAESGKPIVGSIPLNDADFASPARFWSAGQLIQRANVRLAQMAAPDATRFGMIRQDNATGDTSESGVRGALEELVPDAELTTAAVSQGSTDLVGAVSQLGEQDLYFFNLSGSACIQGLEALHSVAPDVPIVAGAACTNDTVVEQAGADVMEGIHYASNSEITTASGTLTEDAETFNARYPDYGDAQYAEDPWAAHEWGILVTLQRVLSELDEAELADAAAIDAAIESFTGPVALGANEVSCPGSVEEQVCAQTVRAYQVLDGVSTPLEGNEYIDIG